MTRKTFKLGIAAVMFIAGVYVMPWDDPGSSLTPSSAVDLTAEIAEMEDRFRIKVLFEDGEEALPDAWRSPPLSAEASPAVESCVSQWILLVKQELGKYRARVIGNYVSRLHFFRDLTIRGVGYGGTMFEDELFLTLDCDAN